MVGEPVEYAMTIGGESVVGSNQFEVINPAIGEVFASAPDATKDELDAAVSAAQQAFPSWSQLPFAQRQSMVAAIGECLLEHRQEFCELITSEQGKGQGGSEFEIDLSAHWCAEVAKFSLPDRVVEDSSERRVELRHVPIGVVGAITPWNVPILIAIWKIAPALLAGNTVVLKPSPYTPLATLRLGELLQNVLPPGVLNVVSGGNQLGQWITEHPNIGKVSFTGSTVTGKRVMESAASSLKRVTLELGGNDAAIVMPDVDPKVVAPALFWGAFFNSAQVCVATKRLYVHADIYDELARELVAYAETVSMGDGAQQGVDLGPVQNAMQYEKVKDLLADCHNQDMTFLTGGEPLPQAGYFIPVSIVDNPPDDARVVQEEAFGPLLPLLKFESVDEVIQRANAADTGLAGSVWSADVAQAESIARQLQTGTVWINEILQFSPHAPFAGHKQSGLGVEHGVEGLLEFTNTQSIFTKKTAA